MLGLETLGKQDNGEVKLFWHESLKESQGTKMEESGVFLVGQQNAYHQEGPGARVLIIKSLSDPPENSFDVVSGPLGCLCRASLQDAYSPIGKEVVGLQQVDGSVRL